MEDGHHLKACNWNVLFSKEGREAWDPGAARLHILYTSNAGVTKIAINHAYKCAFIEQNSVQLGASKGPSLSCLFPSVERATKHSYHGIETPTAAERVCFTAPTRLAAQAEYLAPVCCPKATSIANVESLLLPNLQQPMNGQEASHVIKNMVVSEMGETDASTGRPLLYHSVEIMGAVAVEVEVEVASDKPPFHQGLVVSLPKQTKPDSEQPATRINKVTDQLDSLEFSFMAAMLLGDEFSKEEILKCHSATTLDALFTTAAATTERQCTNASKSTVVQIIVVHSSARKASIYEATTMRSYALQLEWAAVWTATVFVLIIPCSRGKFVAQKSMFLSTGDSSMHNNYYPNLLMQIIRESTIVKVTEQSHPLEFQLIDETMQLGQVYTPQVTSSTAIQLSWVHLSELTAWQTQVTRFYYVWDPGVQKSSHKWLPVLTVRTVAHIQLSCLVPPFEISKRQWRPGIAAALHMHTRIKFLATNAAALLLPAIPGCTCNLALIPWYKSERRLLLTEEKSNSWYKTTTVFLQLLRSEMIHIRSWTSMIYVGISLFACPCVRDFPCTQLDLRHQQDVLNNHNAERQLPLLDYLQLSKMDIIFITFLPP